MTDRDLPARRETSALANGEQGLIKTSFDYELTLEREQVIAHFRDDANVEWAADGNPAAYPSAAGPQFQAWQDARGAILVRHALPAGINGASPLVYITMTPLARGGCRVEGKFLRAPPSMEVAKKLVIAASVAYAGYELFVYLMLGAFQPGLLAVIPVLIALIMQNNRPSKNSLEDYGSELWGLLGRKLVPHVQGSHDSAFRDRALPSSRGENGPDALR